MPFNYPFSVNLVHVALVVPVLAYAGYYGSVSDPQVFTAMMALGALVLFYHGYMLYQRWSQPMSFIKAINIFHVLAVAPLFMYVGWSGAATPPAIFTLLLVLAPIVAAFHAYRGYENWQK